MRIKEDFNVKVRVFLFMYIKKGFSFYYVIKRLDKLGKIINLILRRKIGFREE